MKSNILEISYQIFLAILFIVFFLALLASPIIYINIKQRKYFKQFADKFNLQLVPKSYIIKRDFPQANGNINAKKVWLNAGKLGEYSYNTNFNTRQFASPVTAIGVEFNNHKITKLSIVQKELVSELIVSNFDKYYDVVVEPQSDKNKFINYDIKQKLMKYSLKHSSYVNLTLIDGYLVSICNFELISANKYKNVVANFQVTMAISNIKK